METKQKDRLAHYLDDAWVRLGERCHGTDRTSEGGDTLDKIANEATAPSKSGFL